MPPKKKAHQLAELMPPGEVLNSLQKSAWRLGPKLGEGGFGLIYLAHSEASKGEPMYVVKQEPVGNGPLAIECLFFAGLLKPDLVDSWSKKKNISNLGIPKFVAWGLHTFNTNKYRFLVMHRYGFDLQHHFLCGHFSRQTVGLLALRLIDALQFIHESKYVHADIKAANILTPYSQAKKVPASKTVYLVDYGLARKYINGKGVHETYTQDPRTAHDGTIEFTSRDAHMGVKPSRRGDMEILGYCLVQWLCGRLPWEDKLQDKNYVSAQKCKYMKDIPAFMAKCFPKEKPAEIAKYLKLVDDLEYSEEPDYAQYKELFKTFLRGQGISSDAPISFTSSSSTSSASSPARGKKAPPATANNNNNNAKPVPRSKAKDQKQNKLKSATTTN